MKRTAIILITLSISIFSFKETGQENEEHTYTVKGTLNQFVYTNNYLSKVQEMLKQSSLPAKEVFATIDTIEMIKNLFLSQINVQYIEFKKMDSVAESKKKK